MDYITKAKQNVPLVIGLAIPIFMTLFVAAAIYFPRIFTTVEPPKYDFLYMTHQGYGDVAHVVRNGQLVEQKIQRPKDLSPVNYEVSFFVHRVRENRSEEISFEQAAKFRLQARPRSPDGFEIVLSRAGGFIPFHPRWDYRTRYLKKDSYTEKLNLEGDYRFRFLGWIVG